MNKDQMGKQIHYLDAALKECEAENERLVAALATLQSNRDAAAFAGDKAMTRNSALAAELAGMRVQRDVALSDADVFQARIGALEADLAGYKDSHDKYCPAAARTRDLEAALRDMVEAAEVGKVFTSGSRINPVLLKARATLTAPETDSKPTNRSVT